MKGGQEDVPVAGDHLPPSVIAAHADRRLDSAQAARANEHIATCPVCHDVFAETLRFSLDEEASEPEAPSSRFAGIARRPMVKWAAGLAVAAGLLLAFPQTWRPDLAPVAPPLLADLAQAMGSKRFVEPRVTGGFQHGRLIVLRSGDRPRGLDEHSPAVLAAVARIRERAEKEESPATQGALGVTYLVSGDLRAAIKTLESAVEQDPDNARLQSDLSAAYLERARRMDEPADLPKALEAAERSVARPDPPAEAYFNRALALERLHLVDAAREAWNDYLERDPTSGWADEARRHIQELPEARLPTIEEDHARARAALEQGAPAVDHLADESPSILRDYFQDQLLSAWAEAYLGGNHDEALRLRDHAQLIGASLFRTTGDALPRDTAEALIQPGNPATAPDPLRAQAEGFRAMREGDRLYDTQGRSCAAFREARQVLERGRSPQAIRVRERVVAACLYPSEQTLALAELAQLEAIGRRHAFAETLGRARWTQGLIHVHRGDLLVALDRYRLAAASFLALRDTESTAVLHGLMAENLSELGERREAWRERTRALGSLGGVRRPRRVHLLLEETTLACLNEGLLRAALSFQTALVQTAARGLSAAALAGALTRRATIGTALGQEDSPTRDIAEVRALIARIRDPDLAARVQGEADAAEGLLLAGRRPERAADVLNRALGYFERTIPSRVPALRLHLARTDRALGLYANAAAQLEAGIGQLEAQRLSLADGSVRGSFFESAAAPFEEMVTLQIDWRSDPQRALSFVERARARHMLDAIRKPSTGQRGTASIAGTVVPLEPARLRQSLPQGVALIYYWSRPGDLLTWFVTRDGVSFQKRPLVAAQLARMVGALDAVIERRAPLPVIKESAARLYDELIRPWEGIKSQQALFVVADPSLQSVAFAALWDRQSGRYLVEDHVVGLVPSGTAFIRASASASRGTLGRRPSVLAIGNPRLSEEFARELPSLPEAEKEAEEVAGLYPASEALVGTRATKTRFLEGMRHRNVLHFAGHTFGEDSSRAAGLLFAPEAAGLRSSVLNVNDMEFGELKNTRVVVLAACRTGMERVTRIGGAMGLGTPFLAAGVPNVVASLRDFDDVDGRQFFLLLHQRLAAADGDAVSALRSAQIAALRHQDDGLSHPASWAGFVALGGLDRRSLAGPAQAVMATSLGLPSAEVQ